MGLTIAEREYRRFAEILSEFGFTDTDDVPLSDVLRAALVQLTLAAPAAGEAQPSSFNESRSPDGDGPLTHLGLGLGEEPRSGQGTARDACVPSVGAPKAAAGSEPADSLQRDCVAIQTEKPFVGCPEGVWVVIQRDESGEMSLKIAEFYSKELAEAYAAAPGRLAAGEAQPAKFEKIGITLYHCRVCGIGHSTREESAKCQHRQPAAPERRAPAQEPTT